MARALLLKTHVSPLGRELQPGGAAAPGSCQTGNGTTETTSPGAPRRGAGLWGRPWKTQLELGWRDPSLSWTASEKRVLL